MPIIPFVNAPVGSAQALQVTEVAKQQEIVKQQQKEAEAKLYEATRERMVIDTADTYTNEQGYRTIYQIQGHRDAGTFTSEQEARDWILAHHGRPVGAAEAQQESADYWKEKTEREDAAKAAYGGVRTPVALAPIGSQVPTETKEQIEAKQRYLESSTAKFPETDPFKGLTTYGGSPVSEAKGSTLTSAPEQRLAEKAIVEKYGQDYLKDIPKISETDIQKLTNTGILEYKSPISKLSTIPEGFKEDIEKFRAYEEKKIGKDIVSPEGKIILTESENKKYEEAYKNAPSPLSEQGKQEYALISAVGQEKYNKAINIIEKREQEKLYQEGKNIPLEKSLAISLASPDVVVKELSAIYTKIPYLSTPEEREAATRAVAISRAAGLREYEGLSLGQALPKVALESPLTAMIPIGVEFEIGTTVGKKILQYGAESTAKLFGEKALLGVARERAISVAGRGIARGTIPQLAVDIGVGAYFGIPIIKEIASSKTGAEAFGKTGLLAIELPGAGFGARTTKEVGGALKDVPKRFIPFTKEKLEPTVKPITEKIPESIKTPTEQFLEKISKIKTEEKFQKPEPVSYEILPSLSKVSLAPQDILFGGMKKSVKEIVYEPGRGKIEQYTVKDLTPEISEIKLKETPSQIARKDIQEKLGGRTTVFTQVSPSGSDPFKTDIWTGKREFVVSEQEGASPGRIFGKETGFYGAPSEAGKEVPYSVKSVLEAKKLGTIIKISPEIPKIDKLGEAVLTVIKKDKSIAGGSFGQKLLFGEKARDFGDYDIISKNPIETAKNIVLEAKKLGKDYTIKSDTNPIYGNYPKQMIFDELGNKVAEVERTVNGIDLTKRRIITAEGINVVHPEELFADKLSMIKSADENIKAATKAAGDVQFHTGGKVSAQELLSKSFEEGKPQAYTYYAGLGKEPTIEDVWSGRAKIGISGRPTININPAMEVKEFPKDISENPITQKEKAIIEADFKKLREGKFEGMKEIGETKFSDIEAKLRSRGTIEQWALMRRLTNYMREHPGTYSGVGALTGIRGEYELLQSPGIKNIIIPSTIRGKIGKYLGFGETSVEVGGKRFEVQIFRTETPEIVRTDIPPSEPIFGILTGGQEFLISSSKAKETPIIEPVFGIKTGETALLESGISRKKEHVGKISLGIGTIGLQYQQKYQTESKKSPDWINLGISEKSEKLPVYEVSKLFEHPLREIKESRKSTISPKSERKTSSVESEISKYRKSSDLSKSREVSVKSLVSSGISRETPESLVSIKEISIPSRVSQKSDISSVSISKVSDFSIIPTPEVSTKIPSELKFEFKETGKRKAKKEKPIYKYRYRPSPIVEGVEKLFENNPLEPSKIKKFTKKSKLFLGLENFY